jgi:hypothetical protein
MVMKAEELMRIYSASATDEKAEKKLEELGVIGGID